MTDLFAAAGVEVATGGGASLPKARALLAEVEGLADIMDPSFHDACERAARHAENLGAHAVARACRWVHRIDSMDRHGYDHLHAKLENITRRYVQRIERERL